MYVRKLCIFTCRSQKKENQILRHTISMPHQEHTGPRRVGRQKQFLRHRPGRARPLARTLRMRTQRKCATTNTCRSLALNRRGFAVRGKGF